MFNKKEAKQGNKNVDNLKIDTIIAPGVVITGDLRGHGALRIDGKIEGNIDFEKGIVLGEKGVIKGNIKSADVIIYGRLNGNLDCKNLFLKPTGVIAGDMNVDRMAVDSGGKYNGNIKMNVGAEEISLPHAAHKKEEATQKRKAD